MQPLSPKELLKHATHFAAEEQILVQGKRIAGQIRSILSQYASESESERSTTLKALGDAVILTLERYQVGADLQVVAWTTRSIFELEFMLAFVTASPENLRSFANDIVLDEIQVREAGIALDFDRRDPEVARRQDEALERLRKRKAELGLTRNRPMSTSEMARCLGREAEYNAHWRRRRAGGAHVRGRGPILASRLPAAWFGVYWRNFAGAWRVVARSWRKACKSMKTW